MDDSLVVARLVYGTHVNVPELIVRGGATYRIVHDHLGSPRLVIDQSTGIVIQCLDYDEWGIVTLDTNPGFQPFRFAGGLYDTQTKLLRFGFRDYDSSIGRWLTLDHVRFSGWDSNLFGYVLGDPVNRLDPTGLQFITPEEGRRLADAARSWEGTAYLEGAGKRSSRAGADCSGAVWRIYEEAGLPYDYSHAPTFPDNPRFRPAPGNVPQVGDVGWWNGHVLIYDPGADAASTPNKRENAWSAFRPERPFGPARYEGFEEQRGEAVTWYRYYVPPAPTPVPCH